MPKPTKGRRLGGSASHQKAMLANLATSLFEHGRITTTEAKAKRLNATPVAQVKIPVDAVQQSRHNSAPSTQVERNLRE